MRPSLKLPEGTTVLDVAEASRDAIEAFLAVSPDDKLALSRWLIGAYRGATRFAPRRFQQTAHPSAHAPATLRSVAAVVAQAQTALEEAIDAASEPGAERLLAVLPDAVDVIPVHDAYGGRGFAAQDVAHRHLTERAMTLLLADWLTRPDEYVAKREPGRARRPSARMLALA